MLITPVLSVFDAEHGVPERSGHDGMAEGAGVEALEGVNEVNCQKGPDAILEWLHLDGHVLSSLVLEFLVPFGCELMEL